MHHILRPFRPTNQVVFLLLIPLLAMGLFVSLALLLPPRSFTITMGHEEGLNAYGQGTHLYNFFGWGNPGTEQGKSARRMEPIASFLVPYAFRLGEPLDIAVTMCGGGNAESVRLALNGEPYDVPLAEGWKTWRVSIDHTPTTYEQMYEQMHEQMYERSLYLEWQSDASDTSTLPLLHQVTITAARPHDMLIGALLLGLAVAVVGAIGMIGAILAIGSAESASRRAQLTWITVIVGSALVGYFFYQPQLLSWGHVAALGGGAAVVITLLSTDIRHRLVLWALCVWILAVPQLLGTWILDDAFISFRYAENLVNGFGLTFNPGGDIVEGYTNFLWTLILAGTIALGWEPVLTAQFLCTALALATLLLAYRGARGWWPTGVWALLPPALLAINPSFLLYTTRGSGMETALVTFLSLIALLLLWRAQHVKSGLVVGIFAGVVCALVVMARPDGALVPLAGGIVLSMHLWSREGRAWAFPTLGGLIIGFSVLYLPYFAWRWSYYGFLLPNTFYAKTGATVAQVQRGWYYTRDFFQSLGLRSLIVLLGLSGVAMVRTWWQGDDLSPSSPPSPSRRSPAVLLWTFLLLTAGYVTAVGGDHFPLWRFFVVVTPPLMLLITHGAVEAWHLTSSLSTWLSATLSTRPSSSLMARAIWGISFIPTAVAVMALLLFTVLNITPLPSLDSRDPRGRIWGEHYVALKNRELGWWVRFNTPPDAVIATGIAGAMPFYGHRTVIDTLGLNNVHIAHLDVDTMGEGVAGAEKTDTEYVLNQQPDYIPHATSGAFADNPRFQQHYELMTVRGPEGGELLLYVRVP